MNNQRSTPLSWLARLGFALAFVLALVAGIVLSAAFFAVLVALALVGGAWLWWQQRRLRRQAGRGRGEIIDVEYEVLEERPRDRSRDDRGTF